MNLKTWFIGIKEENIMGRPKKVIAENSAAETKQQAFETVLPSSVLAFSRAFEISDAIFLQCNSNTPQQEKSVVLRNKYVKCAFNQRNIKDEDAAKANLQLFDIATLGLNEDTLIVRFSIRVKAFDGTAEYCNSALVQENIKLRISEYIKEYGFDELSRRYAANLANARWLWRNRVSAESVTVTIKNKGESVVIQDAKKLPLNSFDNYPKEVNTVADWIKKGLKGESGILLEVEARALIGVKQEVFPSQELTIDANSKSNKSKVLYYIYEDNERKAAMHSQKIGNAFRTIDDWYPQAQYPISVESYGAVPAIGTAFRLPSKKLDFFYLFDNWVMHNGLPTTDKEGKTTFTPLSENDKHYVVASMLRGGVFSNSSKEKGKETAAKE